MKPDAPFKRRLIAAAVVLTAALPPAFGEASTGPVVSRSARALHERLLTLDTHLDTPMNFELQGWDILKTHDRGQDGSQVDLPRAEDSGLAHAVGLLEGVKGVAVSRFAAEDVVRHPLVERIVRAYEADSAKRGRPG